MCLHHLTILLYSSITSTETRTSAFIPTEYKSRDTANATIVVGNKVNSSIVEDKVLVVGSIYARWTCYNNALHHIIDTNPVIGEKTSTG